jgi:hypothetical protein
MNRFGSSRLRIVWTLASLLLAGLAFGSVQELASNGTHVVVFGSTVPLGSNAAGIAADGLASFLYTLVPATFVLGGFGPFGDWLASGSRGERFKGLFLGALLAFVHGLFLSQVALLPVLAAAFKLFGPPFASGEGATAWNRILQADLNGVVLGLQLLLWAGALSQIVKSNRGLAILGAYALAALGRGFTWVGQSGADLELPRLPVKAAGFLGHLLPSESLPSDALAWTALPLAIGGPILLCALLLFLPGKAVKTSSGKAISRKAKA